MRLSVYVILSVVSVRFVACGDDGSGDRSLSVGGRVETYENDLIGGLVLQNNGGDDETVDANSISNTLPRPFVFDTKLVGGSDYLVTVLNAPDYQICEVINGRGTVDNARVEDVDVNCVWGPPDVLSVTPPDGSVIATDATILLEFAYPMNDNSLATSGTMGAINMAVGYTDFEIVLLSLKPNLASWPTGSQTLVIDINGESGIALPTLTLNYTVN